VNRTLVAWKSYSPFKRAWLPPRDSLPRDTVSDKVTQRRTRAPSRAHICQWLKWSSQSASTSSECLIVTSLHLFRVNMIFFIWSTKKICLIIH
jgi:hypothetical protein